MTLDAAGRAADLLSRGRIEGETVTALPEDCRPADEAGAYAVQNHLHGRLSAAGFGRLVGHKIGCTTAVMQAFLDIARPCSGGILEAGTRRQTGVFRHSDYRRVGVECEIVVRLAGTLAPDGAPHSRAGVEAAVESVMAAIEVVDDRYDNYRELGAPTLIADDFFHVGCVLGRPVSGWRGLDLTGVSGRMSINGRDVGAGIGADIMGHPLEALAWLANSFAARGQSLRAGEFVLLGSVVETRWVAAGDIVDVQIDGLGDARAKFE